MNRYLEEMSRLAARRGLQTSIHEDGLQLELDGTSLCHISDAGVVRYRKLNVGLTAHSQMLDDIIEEADLVRKYVSAMEDAPFLMMDGQLKDKYKVLLDYGGYILAGHDRGRCGGFEFVTWQWSWEHTAVSTGRYWEDNYRGAMEDFAMRSGLIDGNRLFSEAQTVVLYRLIRNHINQAVINRSDRGLYDEIIRKIESSVPKVKNRQLIEELADDPRTGYTLVQNDCRTSYAIGLFDRATQTYLYKPDPDLPHATLFKSPYDGLVKLCQSKIHLRDYEQPLDYPIVLTELQDADSLVSHLNWNYGVNTGFLLDDLAFIKAVSEMDEWLFCKQENGSWTALDHVSLSQIIKQHGEDYFGHWIEALQICPVDGYPAQLTIPTIPTFSRQDGPTL